MGDQLRAAPRSVVAFLPIRFFFGATFLYAGFDKLLDPRFFDPSSPASIQSQMAAFARGSPIGGLVALGEPAAASIGLVIAMAEIAVGLGALSGIAFRVAAAGGALLSALFWLTVSWPTHPYYLGSDLPYAIGWLALAIAGHGGLFVPRRVLASEVDPAADARVSPGRRAVLQTGLLAFLALTAASLAVPLRLAGLERIDETGSGELSDRPTASATASAGGPTPSSTSLAVASGPSAGLPIATIANVERRGSAAFTIPLDAPSPLPAGDPGVVVRLQDGSFVAFDAVCTHAGCTVEWDSSDRLLLCPCHGAAFDPARGAAVVDGPTNQPLAPLPITVDQASGRILLQA